MAQSTHFIDGRVDLQQQQDQINFIETIAFCEVLTYTKLPNQATVNRAVFDDVPFAAEHKDIELIAIGPGVNPGAVIAAKMTAGKQVIFHSTVAVGGVDTVVVAVR